jgi:uncharacterized protein YdeI (YjbR/CyaY-like superfamily)
MTHTISKGVAHDLPADLKKALLSDTKALSLWETITPLARNEWICWTISVKKAQTRSEHVERVISELKDGMRRPCCWIGCVHRKDKSMSRTQKFISAKTTKN